jgi:hypothetical protein
MAIDKIEAILKLDSNARIRVISDQLIWLDNNPNNITEEQINNKILELEQEEQNKKANKASAQAKLEALGLTTEEIKALIGQ